MYSNTQLHDMIENGVPESATKIILRELLNRPQPSFCVFQIFKHPENNDPTFANIIQAKDMILGYINATTFGYRRYTGPNGGDVNNPDYYELVNPLNPFE